MAKTKSDTSSTDDIAALRRELEAERASRQSLETDLQSERRARREAEKAGMSAQERELVTALESTDTRLESLESEIAGYEDDIARLADEPGHGKEIAQINRKLAAAVATQLREQDKKTYLAAQRDQMKAKRDARPADDEGPKTPDGQLLSAFPEPVQRWLRAHPNVMQDGALYRRAVAAANVAIAEGKPEGSDGFFEVIEDKLGLRQPTKTEEDGAEEDEGEEIEVASQDQTRRAAETSSEVRYEAEKPQHRAAGPGSMSGVAPASRRIPTGSGRNGAHRVPTLTAQEKEAALELYSRIPGMSDADKLKKYAENKAFMQTRQPGYFASHGVN